MKKEPETNEELDAAITKRGHEIIDCGNMRYTLRRKKTGATTSLDAEDWPSALFEGWQLVKP